MVYSDAHTLSSSHADHRTCVMSESPSVRAMGGDCYGHGTAVASLAAGRYSGLAPGADVGSVRVLDCEGNGRISDVIAGLDAAVEHWLGLGGGSADNPVGGAGAGSGAVARPGRRPPAVLTLSLAGRALHIPTPLLGQDFLQV